jgi:hypothetical protein
LPLTSSSDESSVSSFDGEEVSQLPTFRILKLLFELINLYLKLELHVLGGELLHSQALWNGNNGGGLSAGGITLRWRCLIHAVKLFD